MEKKIQIFFLFKRYFYFLFFFSQLFNILLAMKIQDIFDIFMFRLPSKADNYSVQPRITTGSIVWGILLRTLLIIVLTLFLTDYFDIRQYWWFSLFAFWGFAAFPAYKQIQAFSERIDDFEESTLCGQCKHFDKSGQRCSIYDEHVSVNYIPCEGLDWEPKPKF